MTHCPGLLQHWVPHALCGAQQVGPVVVCTQTPGSQQPALPQAPRLVQQMLSAHAGVTPPQHTWPQASGPSQQPPPVHV
jgi:hypothetical protein